MRRQLEAVAGGDRSDGLERDEPRRHRAEHFEGPDRVELVEAVVDQDLCLHGVILTLDRPVRQWQNRRMSQGSGQTHEVAVLALEAVVPMDLAAPAQVFGYPEIAPYRLTLCGREAGEVATTGGFAIVARHGLEALRAADTVIVPGFVPHDVTPAEDVLEALRTAHARGARIVSICTGAFALAAAGLLDGRRATTHWLHAAELARHWPRVTVVPDVLYVHDEPDVLTSAGVASGIDLCLHIVRSDFGAAVGNTIARRIVVARIAQGARRSTSRPRCRTIGSRSARWSRRGPGCSSASPSP